MGGERFMKAFESSNKLREYPDDSKEYRTLEVCNHWKLSDRVVLLVNGKEQGVYIAQDLIRAINNATNAHRT